MAPAIAVLAIGVGPTEVLVFSQVVLSFGIPFALIPLVLLTAGRDVMGVHVNRAAHDGRRVRVGRADYGVERLPDLPADPLAAPGGTWRRPNRSPRKLPPGPVSATEPGRYRSVMVMMMMVVVFPRFVMRRDREVLGDDRRAAP